MTFEKRRLFLLICILIFIIFAAGISLYSQGYILDGGLNLSKRGGLYITAPYSGSEIFINNKKEKITGMLNAGLFLSGLKPKEYSVIVAKNGFWPWTKNLKVAEGYVNEARAFMVPKEPGGDYILKGKFIKLWSSPYQKILLLQEKKNNGYHLIFYIPGKNIFLSEDSNATDNLLSFTSNISSLIWGQDNLIFKTEKGAVEVNFDASNRSVSASYFTREIETNDGGVFEKNTAADDQKIWWKPETNEIFVDWLKQEKTIPYYICPQKPCELPLQIFHSRLSIKNIDFFPYRKDIIVLAISNGVYALEIDGRSNRLIQPIYKGKDPNFAVLRGEETVYVLDEGSLIKVYLK